MNIRADIEEFVEYVGIGSVDIYNEFSLQHELGIFLRGKHPDKKVQFERNISYFGLNKAGFAKREIDISLFSSDKQVPNSVIELKYPRNGQVPEQMFSFCKDIAFLEQLTTSKFQTGYFLAFADDPLFFSGNSEKIYAYFRGGKPLNGTIQKPTGSKDQKVEIRGNYSIEWRPVSGNTKYCLIDMRRSN